MIALRAPGFAAAVLSMLVLPLAVLGLRAPLWLGVLAAALTLGAGWLYAVRRTAPRVARTARPAAHAAVLEEAEAAHTALLEAIREVRDARTRACLGGIARSVRALIDRVAGDSTAFAPVQRALAYYAPRAGTLATAYAVMEEVGEHERLPDVARVLARIEGWLARCLDLTDSDSRHALDVELKLIDDALDEDSR
jgi:hypothetical protein